MGEIISLGDSFLITIFSMLVVFTGLIILAFCISTLKNIGSEKKVKEVKDEVKEKVKEADPIVEVAEESNLNDEELVAVIAASIAASLGVSIPEINIKSIRRVPQNTPIWALAGRQESINGKL